ncbi:hypothetical protein CAOG_08088 [Capsaspora owczarzaki ATCC 30864]|uniref:Uncharacterized protein n=1 Tax=Capsaspora owczarzaki (strain ATCC 30864) TaxID=595528 RepID=A0A0D2USW7_CAPO3|nr:hypothetical protein CAOG_08088 [Capsaspora owczarzaki ATCC 30864]KJE98051.1 hypothetical protein CAOG_008088 [Capsaspora owczarzaki ATCC 30864]|eukprot:XP_004342689.1 hypothetical protein CAOG_08088 [Capsaspora owczarzaki ATCC 30864]
MSDEFDEQNSTAQPFKAKTFFHRLIPPPGDGMNVQIGDYVGQTIPTSSTRIDRPVLGALYTHPTCPRHGKVPRQLVSFVYTVQCIASVKDGSRQCRNRTSHTSKRCHVHR